MPSDIHKNDVNPSDTDTGITCATDKSELHVKENVVKHDVKVKVESDTDGKTFIIKSCVGEVVQDIVHKIDVDIVEVDNQTPETLTAEPMENTQIVPMENTTMICTDDSAKEDSSVVASEYGVQNKTDETIAQPCPVHCNKPPDVDFVQADIPVVDLGQPPVYVKAEAEAEAPGVYIKTEDGPTADSIQKSKRTITFSEVTSICQNDSYTINTCAQLDDTISSASEDALVIDDALHEKSIFEELSVSISAGNVVAHPDESCRGGEVPLEDQDGFESTPPCSQIPCVDPYKKKSDAGNVESRYTALTYISLLFFIILHISHLHIA